MSQRHSRRQIAGCIPLDFTLGIILGMTVLGHAPSRRCKSRGGRLDGDRRAGAVRACGGERADAETSITPCHCRQILFRRRALQLVIRAKRDGRPPGCSHVMLANLYDADALALVWLEGCLG